MTIARISIGALALTLALGACGDGAANQAGPVENAAPLEQIAAPNNGDWREIVTQTEAGGFLVGNPQAPVKLIEYASLACPACKAFSDEATRPLMDNYVRTGQVSWEFRNFLLNAPDYAFTLLARCQPPAAFFRTVEQMYQQQTEFFEALDETERAQVGALPPEQQIVPLARAMDLNSFFARRGMNEGRFTQCLNDAAAIETLTQRTQRASQEDDVRGTPTFIINGTNQEASRWSELEPLLRTALGQ